MAIPTVRDWTATEVITEAKLDEISTALNFLLSPPRCRAYSAAGEAVAAGSWEGINLTAEAYDSHNAHDNTTNNSRLTPPESGLYTIFAAIQFPGVAGAASVRGLEIRANAGGVQANGTLLAREIRNVTTPTEGNTAFGVEFDFQLTTSDYIELFAYNGDSVSRSLTGGDGFTYMGFRFVAKTV